ncbi:MAG: ADP-glyceromanno-heptose 6-epimerase [Xanthomonadaceae bacterium]|nr:ADP-glyceromanno-heptose 6-epimerase [Xanthomonadaceae bacterium]
MKTIAVTGAAGFIGSRTILELQKRGYKTISVDAVEHFQTRGELSIIPHEMIIAREGFIKWLLSHSVEAIFHLGACTDTTELDENYLRQINFEYSQAIWSHCARKKIPLIYASSAATYGGGENGYDDNEDAIPTLQPLNPYGWSKQAFDIWALSEERAGRTPSAWSGFKFFNVYGWGEKHKKKMASVIVHAFHQINATGKMKLFRSHKAGIGDGEQKRDFIFVEDVVDVLLFAYEKSIRRGIFNLGTGQARTFLDLIRATFMNMGRTENIEFIDTPEILRARYQYFTQAEMGKLLSLGYTRPFTSLEDGVARYVSQLKNNSPT